MQTLYAVGLFDRFDNADEILKTYLLTDAVDKRRESCSEELNDDNVIQWYYSQIRLERSSNIKYKNSNIFSSLVLSDVGVYLRDCPFKTESLIHIAFKVVIGFL